MFFYLPYWFFQVRFLGKRKPLQTVLFISDECNLSCKHCTIFNNLNPTVKSIDQIRDDLLYSYKLGSRFIDFEGGEPMIWRDGDKDINNLIALAKEIGFFSTTVTTNAQIDFKNCAADSIWVSMDGIGKYHDNIRGEGTFAKLEKNIANSNHKALSVNMVINSQNYSNVEEAIVYAKQNPAIKSISLNFHTPYSGTEELFLDWDLRCRVIDKIIEMKRKKFPIMNSESGLKIMKNLNFKKVCWICNFILPDGTRLSECVGKSYNMCDQCGLCMAGEMRCVWNLKPDTIMSGLNLRL
jgi:MoaA/NifB/PqqE/SkfB family radical SAM enzyme